MLPTIFSYAALLLFFMIFSEPVFAGPGGKIASADFDIFFGGNVLGLLTIFLLPLILLMRIRVKLAERLSAAL